MRTPKLLLYHRFDLYPLVVSGYDRQQTYPTLLYKSVPCNVQDAGSEILQQYKQRDEQCNQVCYLLDKAVFNAVNISDRIVFNGLNYRVVKKNDLCNRGKIFRLDLVEEGTQ